MTQPGFSAETSLYKSRVDYRSGGTGDRPAGIVQQLVFARGTTCSPCNRFGEQSCYNCYIEPGTCYHWIQKCLPSFE
jgi:hypothetical protein